MTNTITQLDHQDGGRKRTSGRWVIALVGALIAFGTLFSSGADAAGYGHRNRAAPLGYAYNTQANPNYGFGPLVAVQPTDVVSGNRIAVEIKSFLSPSPVRDLVEEMLLVTDDEMRDAMRLLLTSDDVVAEPAAAASVAALVQRPQAHARPVIALITGRNVAPGLTG